MKCPPGFCIPDEGMFNDMVDIRVFPPLQLINPSDGHLLLPQNGNTRIRTNRYIVGLWVWFMGVVSYGNTMIY